MSFSQTVPVRRPSPPVRGCRLGVALLVVACLGVLVGCSPAEPSSSPPSRSAQQDAEVFARMVNASWALADRSQPDVFAETLRFLLDNHAEEPYRLVWDRTADLVRLDKGGDVVCVAVSPPPSLSAEMDARVVPCP